MSPCCATNTRPSVAARTPSRSIVDYPEESNRWSVALRLILAIPQIIVLVFVLLAWLVTVVIAWFAILFTGRYPDGLYGFGVGVQRWTLRVQAYLFLMRDEYPPFSLE